MPRRCRSCCRGLPEWDTHYQCSQHRECSKTHPCVACSLWNEKIWALSEAWHKTHIPFQRAPALVPSASPAVQDLPTDALVTPAQPGGGEPGFGRDRHRPARVRGQWLGDGQRAVSHMAPIGSKEWFFDGEYPPMQWTHSDKWSSPSHRRGWAPELTAAPDHYEPHPYRRLANAA